MEILNAGEYEFFYQRRLPTGVEARVCADLFTLRVDKNTGFLWDVYYSVL